MNFGFTTHTFELLSLLFRRGRTGGGGLCKRCAWWWGYWVTQWETGVTLHIFNEGPIDTDLSSN